MFKVRFSLRKDTKGYNDTNLVSWKPQIICAIEDFNKKDSRITDKAFMTLVEVERKQFTVSVDIDQRFSPPERSFYTRVGAVSRTLKELGMENILSPHGKLFSLDVEGEEKIHEINTTQKEEEKAIYIDYKNKGIMIPKEMVDEYVIKFY